MKNITLFTLILFVVISVCNGQKDPKIQPILKLTNTDLHKIGVTIKNQQIFINNEKPGTRAFQLIITGNSYNPKIADNLNIPKTNFDFYPYYITGLDSIYGFLRQDDEENELKSDPLFKRKMFNYLVPVKINRNDSTGSWGKDLLFWFMPTESFRKILSDKYTINREYVPDTLITSDVALTVSDDDLKNIGFVINNDGMYLETFMFDKEFGVDSTRFYIKWFNDKTDYGEEMITGKFSDDSKEYQSIRNKYPDYYIVKVVDINGNMNFDMNYKGRAVPIYIRNSNRNYAGKTDVVIYLKYTKSLIEKLSNWDWWRMPDRYTIVIK